MARPLRIEYPGAVYHVMNPGLARQTTFRALTNYESFLQMLGETQKRFDPYFNRPSVRQVMQRVAVVFGVEVLAFKRGRCGEVNHARKVAMYLVKRSDTTGNDRTLWGGELWGSWAEPVPRFERNWP